MQKVKDMRLVLRTWILPTFQKDAAWTLYSNGEKFVVRRFTDQKLDFKELERWEDPRIRPETSEAFVEAVSESPKLRLAVDDVLSFQVPVRMTDTKIRLDGTSYGILIGTPDWKRFEAQWHEEGPLGWESFAKQVTELQILLDSFFESSLFEWYKHEIEVGKKLHAIHLWTAHDAARIEGLMTSFTVKLYDNGLLTDIASIYRLRTHRETLASLHPMGKSGADELLEQIERSKRRPLDRIINGLVTRGTYGHTGEIAKQFGTLRAFLGATREQLAQVPGLSPESVEKISTWLSDPANLRAARDLMELGLNPEPSQ